MRPDRGARATPSEPGQPTIPTAPHVTVRATLTLLFPMFLRRPSASPKPGQQAP